MVKPAGSVILPGRVPRFPAGARGAAAAFRPELVRSGGRILESASGRAFCIRSGGVLESAAGHAFCKGGAYLYLVVGTRGVPTALCTCNRHRVRSEEHTSE